MIMSRIPWTDEQERFIFERDNGKCQRCGKRLVFGNRHKSKTGAWHMGHRRAIAEGGSNHLRNIIAECIICNLKQGTTSFAEEERKMSYDSKWDGAKNFLNQELGTNFDLKGVRRSESLDYILSEFERKARKLSFEQAEKLHDSIVNRGNKWHFDGIPQYKIYYEKAKILEKIFGK